jgi:two-component sensor histidine kinase
MESLLRFLPSKPQPILVRYGISAVLVLIAFALHLGASAASAPDGFIIYVPAILMASILFDRGSGFVATAVAAGLVALSLDWSPAVGPHIASIVVFALVCVFVVIVGEGMRTALERLWSAQQVSALLLQEQGHRIKNVLALASSLLTLQARASPNPNVTTALETAVARLNVLAASHDHLRIASGDAATTMQGYLAGICADLGDTVRGLRPIAIQVEAHDIVMPSQRAHQIGLIVNELVTNALKYAFPDNAAGNIRVTLERMSQDLVLSVQDDGVGCPPDAPDGLGTRLIRLLVQQLGGSVTREALTPGCRVRISLASG